MVVGKYLGLSLLEICVCAIAGLGFACLFLLFTGIIPYSPFFLGLTLVLLTPGLYALGLLRSLANIYNVDEVRDDGGEIQDSVTHEYNWNHESFHYLKMLYLEAGVAVIVVICVIVLINVANLV